jgi:hypothetical protein
VKIDFNRPILDLDGNPLKTEDGRTATLLSLAKSALIGQFADEQGLSTDAKVARFELAMKLVGGNYDLDASEVVLLKTVIGKGFGPLPVGVANRIIKEAELGVREIKSVK